MDRDDLINRCRIAMEQYGGHPNGAWSTGEKLAVALVLDDTDYITAMGYTVLEAATRVHSGMAEPVPADICTYLRGVQNEIDA